MMGTSAVAAFLDNHHAVICYTSSRLVNVMGTAIIVAFPATHMTIHMILLHLLPNKGTEKSTYYYTQFFFPV